MGREAQLRRGSPTVCQDPCFPILPPDFPNVPSGHMWEICTGGAESGHPGCADGLVQATCPFPPAVGGGGALIGCPFAVRL